MKAEEIIRDMPKGLFAWYAFKAQGRLLYITEDTQDSLTEYFKGKEVGLLCCTMREAADERFVLQHEKEFDYIVIVQTLAESAEPKSVLINCNRLLNLHGTLLLGLENRLGLRYFCGDRDPYTGRNFDGIEHYRRADIDFDGQQAGRNYDHAEIEELLKQSGWEHYRFYSVLPSLEYPQLIYAQDYEPEEELEIRYFPSYHFPDTVFLEEEFLYTDLIRNGMFHKLANAYLVECAKDGKLANVKHVTLSTERGEENALATVITRDGNVEKRALYPQGKSNLRQLVENGQALEHRGIKVIPAEIQGDVYVMPYISAETGVAYLKRLAWQDIDLFIAEVDRFRDLIFRSSECVEEMQQEQSAVGVILKKGYIDLVPLNCFVIDGEFVFFDQEFCLENCPANLILYRVLQVLYLGALQLQKRLPCSFFWKRYGMEEQIPFLAKQEGEFLSKLRNRRELKSFHEITMRNAGVVNTNRQRMNYSAGEYQRLFVNIFQDLNNRKLILFGSGSFTRKFLALFGRDYHIDCILDNNEDKWGTEMEGITIKSPDYLKELQPQDYKVIVCVKNYLAIVRQLEKLGVKHFGIYDINVEYPRKQPLLPSKDQPAADKVPPKKYQTGYIAGVFDLFHIGHLNMFKRAKEQCDYLIVGVVTDEGVRRNKKTEPFVPFEERIEMVRSCKYVDEAVEIPLNYAGTKDAFLKYHFDCQFSGSDYIDNPDWLGEKTFLEKNGAEMVFFPYTQSTSSTKLKKLIDKGLA